MEIQGVASEVHGVTGEVKGVASDVPRESVKSTIRQRNYTLNDVGALKKKLTHEKRISEIAIAKEAKNFSNVVIEMKASFFEYVKASFINHLEKNPEILNIDNAEFIITPENN